MKKFFKRHWPETMFVAGVAMVLVAGCSASVGEIKSRDMGNGVTCYYVSTGGYVGGTDRGSLSCVKL